MKTQTVQTTALLQRFQAIAEETRFDIIRRLAGGECCVCELQDEMNAAQSRLSFHLRKLKDAGLVSDRRCGRWVYYCLVPEALAEMRTFLGTVQAGDAEQPVAAGVAADIESSCVCCD